ncbi:hypothetical protein [Neopusillimonas aromaticivorans]|uniref:hypothetical protein n=1 Tax=Neopusillimonas aromaticivorans TaxID=2979868 RepID=UPI002596E93A|nr:hypothetical protein [Neopusillimonas aromaticivorans]WJJ93869.1 hypothetical protein N7E01_01030 [Neopusillimonas aromaticivorans]
MSGDSVRCLPIDGKVLVFGMDWLPLLGSDARQQALAKARRHQASHFVLASEHAAAMGLVQLSTTAETHSGLPYSAAQVMAALHPVGTVVALIGISLHYGGWLRFMKGPSSRVRICCSVIRLKPRRLWQRCVQPTPSRVALKTPLMPPVYLVWMRCLAPPTARHDCSACMMSDVGFGLPDCLPCLRWLPV